MSPQPGVVPLDVSLRPDELVDAWRPVPRRLVLTAATPVRVQQRIAARITAVGVGLTATITGRVATVSRSGDLHRIELAPDETRVSALERLVAVARGEVVDWATRIPRFLAAMPAVVHLPVGPTYMTTFSVSEKGCGLSWTGPVPEVGAPMDVRIGAGSRATRLRGVVCWTGRSGHTAMVGVHFVSGALNAWSAMLGDVRRAGAPLA